MSDWKILTLKPLDDTPDVTECISVLYAEFGLYPPKSGASRDPSGILQHILEDLEGQMMEKVS